MLRPDPEITKQFANAVRQHPGLLQWLQEWRMHELEQLPYALNNPALQQGRCQVLGELVKFAKDAPETAAKS